MYSMDNDIDHILVSEDALKAKVNELGAQISRDYAGKDLLLVSILREDLHHPQQAQPPHGRHRAGLLRL